MTTKVIGADLQWKRDGNDWLLYLGRRRFGRVVPDAKWPGMYRSVLSNGRLSDMANISWSKNAVLDAAVRELEFEARNEPATDPPKTPAKEGCFSGLSLAHASKGRGPCPRRAGAHMSHDCLFRL